MHRHQNVFLVIKNSGSTNFPGYTLTINSDGSGELIYLRRRNETRPQFNLAPKAFPPQTFQLSSIASLLAQIGGIQGIPNHSCSKPISFGSVVSLVYNGQTSGDISCIDTNDPQNYQELKKQIHAFITQAMQ